MIDFTILGEVKPKGRPRAARRGNFIKLYTDKKTQNYENDVAIAFINSGCEAFVNDEALSMNVEIFVQTPKSVSKKKRMQMLNGEIRPTKRPDLDNLLKSILDGLNGVAFQDDSQIVEILATKKYAEMPSARIKIESI